MSENDNTMRKALAAAVSKTLENMAFEQAELIEGDLEQYLAEKSKEAVSCNSPLDDEFHDGAEDGGNSIENNFPGTDQDSSTEKISLTDNIIEKDLWASIPILKPLRGEMVLVFPARYAGQLTDAIYGGMAESCSTEVTVNDAIAEIINIIAGRFVQELLPSDKRFELGLPNTGWGEIPAVENKIIMLSFDLGGNIVTAIVGGEDFCRYKGRPHKIREDVS